MSALPVNYTPSIETPEPDEAETTRQLIETLRGISETVFIDSGHAARGVHAKSHGLLRGELIVSDGLPPHLAQGLFARAARYPVVMRFSTIPGDILDDSVSVPRGLAIKVVGVPGERLPGSEGDTTQDFLLVDGPAFAAPTAKAFLGSLKLVAKTTDKAPGLKKVLSAALRGLESVVEAAGGESGLLKTLGGHAEDHILGETFYSQAAIRYGDHVAKMSVAPLSPALLALAGAALNVNGKPNGLREAVRDFFRVQGGEWELRAQLCTDLATMPVEDASKVWPEDKSPYMPVARIVAPPQDAFSSDNIKAVDDGMAFSPWHGVLAHQPLGSVMRVRKAVYAASARFRSEHNGCPIHEPR
jgi:hypothetical protein